MSGVLVDIEDAVAVLTLNRPEALNALNHAVMEELEEALDRLDGDDTVRCVVITGGARAFAAGADIKEMDQAPVVDPKRDRHLSRWDRVGRMKKPVIAAVSGFALGGGCELAMACDLIVAGESAVFAQPEIGIGVIPGAGGTQRLTKILGKYRAMEMVLTGRRLGARAAFALGLVNRVVADEIFLDEAKKLAREIAKQPPLAARAGKEAVLKAVDMEVEDGLAYERQLFNSLFATEDQKEGMRAFIEKREPVFKGK